MMLATLKNRSVLLLLALVAPALFAQKSDQIRTRLPSPTVTFTVGGEHNGFTPDYGSIHEAVEAAPASGAIILIRPGVYREVVHVDRPNIQLRGVDKDPTKVVIIYNNGAANTCGTFCSATMFVTGDDFYAENLTIANDWGKTGKPRTQAVALQITSDRAILRNVRLLGEQDTLMAGSKPCKGGPCQASRQLFQHCYVEGEVDFIFGNAKAAFEDCEIHSVPHPAGGYITAQSRQQGEDSAYVFDRCRLTADPGAGKVYLGRPWRDYATVIFLSTAMGPHIAPEGWSEWHKGETDRLKTATYAEFHSTGPGANPSAREPLSHQLTAEQAQPWQPAAFLAGDDRWDPSKIH
ncbi:pectinesterase [Granulicella pectinivorans]|jgi:pectin methylesterase-like acyl-CoA thioesterase|uniref:Pectinesterase n=1 Tax=Granulicella pectinivorans TaxID=474950 RepID=A0A1I6M7K6_9BACT|nr:pectinesterase family protein [Granulicella pectinivorans]SFS11667.1 pectinesterase [Granulicella pectinivorans]